MAEPAQYITGLISGISWDQVIEAMLSSEQAHIDSLQNRISENLFKLTTWGSISARLITLQNYGTILSQSSAFQATSAASSDEEILTTTVTGSAQTGLYPLKVYQLSQTHQLISQGFQDTEDEVASANDTITIEVGGGWVDKKTPLSWLNGQTGIYRGSIKITDRSGSSATIDLSGALTIEDVIDAINDNTTIKVTAEIEYDAGNKVGDALKLTDSSGDSNNFKVEEVSGGTTATALGILADVAATEIHGNDINYISWDTSLDFLNDGTGVYKGSIQITDRIGGIDTIDLSSATTLQDVKDLIEAGANTNVDVLINSDTNGITIDDTNGTPTQNLIIEEVGGNSTAQDLGIYTGATGVAGDKVGDRIIPGLNTVLLKTLNGGSGVGSVTGSDDFQITCRDDDPGPASTIDVDISSSETVQEVINAINDDAENGGKITASYDREGNGLFLTDNTGGTGNLSVTALNLSDAAADMGIEKSVSSDILEGDDLDPQYIARCTRLDDLNGGEGVDANKIEITDRSGDSAEIDLSDAETMGDVIDAINAASEIGVTASINSQGNGILITDTTGQSGTLKVEEAGGTTTRDLNIQESSSSTTIDGSFEVTIELSSDDTTLEGVIAAINDADAGVYAAIINDGSGFNPYRLLITSERSGEVGRMIIDPEFSAGEVLELNTTTSGKNAVVVLEAEQGGSILITDSSNQLDQVIPGITLNLLSVDSTETIYVGVEADIEAIKLSINNLIDAYNSLMDVINAQQSYNADTKQRGGPLFGNMSLMNIRNQLHRALTDPIESSASLTSIFDLGISPDLTGHFNVNESKLTEILNNDLEGVKDFFSLSGNVALSSFETTATASTTYSSDYNVGSVNNGDTSSDGWGNPGGGWMDGIPNSWSDYVTLTFDRIRTLHRVIIYTLDSTSNPADEYGIKDYQLQYLTSGGDPDNDDDWETYTTITDNTRGTMTHYLSSISTEAVRLKISDSNDGQYSRIIEFEAYQNIGMGGQLKNFLNYVTDANTGLIAYIEDGLLSQHQDSQERIEVQQKLLETKREVLWRQFTEMEQYLGTMQTQSNWLYQQMSLLNSLAGYY